MNYYPCVKVNCGIQNTGRLCKTILNVNILKKEDLVYTPIEDMEITVHSPIWDILRKQLFNGGF